MSYANLASSSAQAAATPSGGGGMNPATISAIMAVVGPLLQAFTGDKGGPGSTYSEGQQSYIEEILNKVKNMQGGADITQNQGYQGGQDWINSLFNDPAFFDKMEAPMQRQFEEETIPGLANRFASQGSGGSLGSTGFRNQLAREGSNLHTNMAAMRGGMQQTGANQALQYAQAPASNYFSMLQNAMTPTNNTYQQSSF